MTSTGTTAQAGPPEQARPVAPGQAPESRDDPTERPGRTLPGWTGVAAVLAAAAAAGWLLWSVGMLSARPRGHALLPWSPQPGRGMWTGLLLLTGLAAFAAAGLVRGRPGSVLVLTRHGAYQGSVRRTGLLWISPLLTRRQVDVSVRHWRSSPIAAVDAKGTPLQVSVLLVWRVRDTAKAAFAVDDHRRFLREQVEAAVARAVSRHPADDFGGDAPTLRDCEQLGDYLGHLVAAELRPVGVEVFSVTPVRIDYAPEVADAMRRARIAALDVRHRRAVLDEALATVAETVRGIADRGLGRLDDYERKALVRELTVALLSRPPAER